jgi:hypothetical protein
MRPLQDEVIDTMLVEDYTNLATSVSGINDSSYNPFPPSSITYSSGFAPTQVEPISVIAEKPLQVFAPTVVDPYMQGFAPVPVKELRPAGKCTRVIFTAIKGIYTGDASYAYWTDCSGVQKSQFVSDDETLEVDALDGTASGLPFMSYPIGQTPPPIAYEPVDPVAPTPIYTELPVTDGVSMANQEILRPNYTTEGVTMASKSENNNQEILRPNYTTEGVTMASRSEVEATLPTKPASETLPTKESKDLKPYIIVGVLVVGILIASRLFSKK